MPAAQIVKITLVLLRVLPSGDRDGSAGFSRRYRLCRPDGTRAFKLESPPSLERLGYLLPSRQARLARGCRAIMPASDSLARYPAYRKAGPSTPRPSGSTTEPEKLGGRSAQDDTLWKAAAARLTLRPTHSKPANEWAQSEPFPSCSRSGNLRLPSFLPARILLEPILSEN